MAAMGASVALHAAAAPAAGRARACRARTVCTPALDSIVRERAPAIVRALPSAPYLRTVVKQPRQGACSVGRGGRVDSRLGAVARGERVIAMSGAPAAQEAAAAAEGADAVILVSEIAPRRDVCSCGNVVTHAQYGIVVSEGGDGGASSAYLMECATSGEGATSYNISRATASLAMVPFCEQMQDAFLAATSAAIA